MSYWNLGGGEEFPDIPIGESRRTNKIFIHLTFPSWQLPRLKSENQNLITFLEKVARNARANFMKILLLIFVKIISLYNGKVRGCLGLDAYVIYTIST